MGIRKMLAEGLTDALEDVIYKEDFVFDEDISVEVYSNPEGVKDQDSSAGTSFFMVIEKGVTFGKVLEAFKDEGSVKDGTLKFRAVEDCEVEELEMCRNSSFTKLFG